MAISDWITLGAAILVGGGTLFLGIMAWRTIRQTRSIQKAEKRERLLNEIIEWARSIADCGFRHELPISSKLNTDIAIDNLNKLTFLEYSRLSNRSEYIKEVANKFFDEDLYKSVCRTSLKLSGVVYVRGRIVEWVEKSEEEPLFNLESFSDEFDTKEEVALIKKIEEELSTGTRDISELCDEYEGSLNESLSTLFSKIVDSKKYLVNQ